MYVAGIVWADRHRLDICTLHSLLDLTPGSLKALRVCCRTHAQFFLHLQTIYHLFCAMRAPRMQRLLQRYTEIQ